MAGKISVEEMMQAGVHFGHQTHRRNPKMDRYIFGAREGVHIIDLTKTEHMLAEAVEFVKKTADESGQIIFVGTKRQASDLISKYADACGMPYVGERWLGGLLTNYETIKKRLKYLNELDEKYRTGDFAGITKKEKVELDKVYETLNKTLGGLRTLRGIPAAIFVVDILQDKIAVTEAKKLGVPVVAIVDTNTDPDNIDFPIPANDDAKKSIDYVLGQIAGACSKAKATTAKPDTAESVADEEGEQAQLN